MLETEYSTLIEVPSPIISFPYGEEFSTSVYRMHRYWGRKPPNVIAHYIQKYCPQDGIILDPFLGSGTTAIEAIKLGRRVIGIDINPLAIFITKTALRPVRLASLEAVYHTLMNIVLPAIRPLYRTRCKRCRNFGSISFVAYDSPDESSIQSEVPVQISYRCSCSKSVLIKSAEPEDIALSQSIDPTDISDWFPIDLRLPNIRRGIREAKNIFDLYTNRNLLALSRIYSTINQCSSGIVRDCLLLAFSSSLSQCSRLAGVDHRKGEGHVSAMGWILTSFRVMKEHVERNPLETFCFAFQRVLKGKIESNKLASTYSEANNVDDVFSKKATAFISQGSVSELNEMFKGHTVNYIFTDPPHGSSIQYLKLASISNAWLKLQPKLVEEEVLQESSTQSSELNYGLKLKNAFAHIRAVVSDAADIHVYFRGKERERLNATRKVMEGGFQLVGSIFQPQRFSFRTTYRGRKGQTMSAPPGDWILHLIPYRDESSPDARDVEDIILTQAESILRKRAQPTKTKYLVRNIATKIPSEYLVKDPKLIANTIAKYQGEKFIKFEPHRDTAEELWCLKEPCHELTLAQRIELIIIKALIGRDEIGASNLYINQAIYSRLPSELTPDPEDIKNVLERVANKKYEGRDVKYFIKEEYLDKREIHSEIIFALAKAAINYGFRPYVSSHALKRIEDSEFAHELEPIRHKFMSTDAFPQLGTSAEHANVLWFGKNGVHAHFEVEDSADIRESTFARGQQVRQFWPSSERALVVPHKSIKAIRMALKQRRSSWHIIPFPRILATHDPVAYQPFEREIERPPIKTRPLGLDVESKQLVKDSHDNPIAFKLKLHCPTEVLNSIRPGQFLMVGINEKSRRRAAQYHTHSSDAKLLSNAHATEPAKLEYLRIPLSIHRVYFDDFAPSALENRSLDFLPSDFWEWIQPGEKSHIDLLVRLAGLGTHTLYQTKQGEKISALGPLGKPIEFPKGLENAILISGGVGLASLYPIAHHLRERGCRVTLFAGSRDKRMLVDSTGVALPEFAEMGVECHITDEAKDNKYVTQLFLEWLKSRSFQLMSASRHVYSCGPWPMLKEVHKLAVEWDLPCTVLADKLMLCGVGACMSCVVKVMNKQNIVEAVRSCTDGPAFNSREIIWD